jgi:hypothetical protein
MANNIFSGWFQINTIFNFRLSRRPFKVDKNLFDQLYSEHYTKDIRSKYNPALFVDQDQNKALKLLNEIKFNKGHYASYGNELRALKDWLDDFPVVYAELKKFLKAEKISINKKSKQYIQLEILLKESKQLKRQINGQKTMLANGIATGLEKLPPILFTKYEYAYGFEQRKINEYSDDLKFITQRASEEYPIAILFRRQSEILLQIKSLNSMNTEFFDKIKIIEGNAGMGKSNISAYITNSLLEDSFPVIFVKAKDFNGSPDAFDKLFMNALKVPEDYKLDEVLKKLDCYGKKNKKRVTLIFDGLNETTYGNEGFSKIWEKNLDRFIEHLQKYKYIYFVATLRTSYIPRIWADKIIPYSNFRLLGFDASNLRQVVVKYFEEYRITYDGLKESEIDYFRTPLLIDLYCQMLNPEKQEEKKAVFGLEGFKSVFDRYVAQLSEKVRLKLDLGTVNQIQDGIGACSDAMLENLNAFIPLMHYYELMHGEKIVRVAGTIGNEILTEYLIYLDENHDGIDVVFHTQQEVGGYLLSKRLIQRHEGVNGVVGSDFFVNNIIDDTEPVHQLKDDILKFLLIEADGNSPLFTENIDHPNIRRLMVILLQTEILSPKTIAVREHLRNKVNSKNEINEIINGLPSYLFDLKSPFNFDFVKSQLLRLEPNVFEYTWTKTLYDNYLKIDRLANEIVQGEIIIEDLENGDLIVEFLIWVLETTIRELRDLITVVLLEYFVKHPNIIFAKIREYFKSDKIYIYERLILICYGICLREQNNDIFINGILRENVAFIYGLQFGERPSNPKYNYIVIDSIKHIVDLAVNKGIFQIRENELEDFSQYRSLNIWHAIDEGDKDAVRSIYLHWTMSDNPDPLRGDFVHYTIPRLEERDNENTLNNIAHIYKHIVNLGYISKEDELSKRELEFKNGNSLIGVDSKIDRLGKKYSWMSYYDYAGYLLNTGRLNVWQEEDSEFGRHYNRLGDVDLEITNPKSVVYSEKLYDTDLFEHKKNDQKWVYNPMYDSLFDLFQKDDFTMLSGFINQREDESYESRSFLLIESFFIKKELLEDGIEKIENREFDWQNDVINNNSTLSKVYFGELYWADNIPQEVVQHSYLPMDEYEESVEYKKSSRQKKTALRAVKSGINVEYEPTVIDYLWESTSKVIATISATVPAVGIGKKLGLRADCKNLQILDSNLKLAFKSFEFKEGFYTEDFSYLRTDLLREYMESNGYLLVYQIKQHTYDRKSGDGSGDFKGMQFKILRG